MERRPWPPSHQERTAVVQPNDKHSPSWEPFGDMPRDPADALERILGEADALIRRRLIEACVVGAIGRLQQGHHEDHQASSRYRLAFAIHRPNPACFSRSTRTKSLI